MKTENQVCTLEQAKRLKELGVVQDSMFNWCVIMPDPTGERYYFQPVYDGEDVPTLHELIAAAFTVAELGVMLHGCKYRIISREHLMFDAFVYDLNDNILQGFYYKREAELRCSVLIHLIENNLITADEVNKRLSE